MTMKDFLRSLIGANTERITMKYKPYITLLDKQEMHRVHIYKCSIKHL